MPRPADAAARFMTDLGVGRRAGWGEPEFHETTDRLMKRFRDLGLTDPFIAAAVKGIERSDCSWDQAALAVSCALSENRSALLEELVTLRRSPRGCDVVPIQIVHGTIEPGIVQEVPMGTHNHAATVSCYADMEACDVPAHLRAGLARYLVDRIRPGSFLCAVLAGDFPDALSRGDEASIAGLGDIVLFLRRTAPPAAWGTPERLEDWLALSPHARCEEFMTLVSARFPGAIVTMRENGWLAVDQLPLDLRRRLYALAAARDLLIVPSEDGDRLFVSPKPGRDSW